jgi:hypothetical protein
MTSKSAMAALGLVNGVGFGYLAWHLLQPFPTIDWRQDNKLADGDTPSTHTKTSLVLVKAGRAPMYITRMELRQRGEKARWESLCLEYNCTSIRSCYNLLGWHLRTPYLVTSELSLATFYCCYDEENTGWPVLYYPAKLRVTYTLADTGLLSYITLSKTLRL